MLSVQLKKPKTDEAPILQNIVSLLKNRNPEDMTFEIGGNNLHAHTEIVGASSPVLAAMFQNDFEESRTQTVKIEDTTVEVFQQFLHYLYANQVPEMKKEGIAAGLFELADKYEVDSLKEVNFESSLPPETNTRYSLVFIGFKFELKMSA